jgi:hypothetical protein
LREQKFPGGFAGSKDVELNLQQNSASMLQATTETFHPQYKD